MLPLPTTNNSIDLNDDIADVAETISKLKELQNIYTQAKNDAMKLRRRLEGRKVHMFKTLPKQQNQNQNQEQQRATQWGQNQNSNSIEGETIVSAEPQQKRGRGRPRKIKETIELIHGDEMGEHRGECNSFVNIASMNEDDEFNNAVYSIEEDELYVKTKFGKFYDINTLQFKGWFYSYLKSNVWVSYD
jgi:hypothetical protein